MPPHDTTHRYYVYILSRPNGKPFYVGKGKGKRVFNHEAEARKGCKCHKCNTIRKIWRNGGEVQRYIVFTTDDEATALAYEVELIALHGRHNLTNRTDGGEGTSGLSAEARAKIGAASKGKKLPPERAEKVRAMVRSPHVIAKNRAAHLGKTVSAETRAKISTKMRPVRLGKKDAPEARENKRAARLAYLERIGNKESPETCERKRAAMLAYLERKRASETNL